MSKTEVLQRNIATVVDDQLPPPPHGVLIREQEVIDPFPTQQSNKLGAHIVRNNEGLPDLNEIPGIAKEPGAVIGQR